MTIVINGTTGISGVDGSAGTPAVQGTDTNTGVFYPAADTVGVSTGGSERLRVDSSGNVGIGTTNTTDQRLKVKQSADTGASSFSFKVEANANDTGLYIGYRGAGAATAADTCAITATYGSTGAFKPMTFLTSDAERMRIDSSGNVGIGTSSPATQLHVSGTNAVLNITRSTKNFYLNPNYANGGSYATFESDLALATVVNGSERMRIDSSGNLLVGTTSTDIAAVGIRLMNNNQVQASKSGDWSFRMGRRDSAGIIAEIYYNSSRVGDISTNGSNTTYNSASDYRLKENVQPMVGALERVALLKPCTYTWKINGSTGEGFIAHELQEIVPDAVNGIKDAVDTEGNIVPQSIDTSFLVATLTAALQEAHGLIKDLQTRVATLEAK